MSSKSPYLKFDKEFKRALKQGKRVFSQNLILYSIQNNLYNSRLGIRISKGEIPLATRRNRIKRVLREYWRLNKPPIQQKRDFVIIVKRGVGQLKNEELVKELHYIFNKILS